MPLYSDTAAVARTIEALDFDAKRFKLMDEVVESGERIVITRYGSPAPILSPYREIPKGRFGRD